MAGNADYIAKFRADTKEFTDKIQGAKKSIEDFNKSNKKASDKMSDYFDGMLKKAGALAAGYLSVKTATEVFNKAINSTQTSQDAFRRMTEQVKTGLDEFYRTLATGNWHEFHDNLKTAVKLAGELDTALDNLDTSKLRNQLQLAVIDMKIAQITAERAKFDKNTQEFKNLSIEYERLLAQKTGQVEYLADKYKDALVKLARSGTMSLKMDDDVIVRRLTTILDETTEEYKQLEIQAEKLKKWKAAANAPVSTGSYSSISEWSEAQDKRVEAQNQLKTARGMNDILYSSADFIMEHKDDFKQFIELFNEYAQGQIKLAGELKTENEKQREASKAQQTALNTEIAQREKLLELIAKTQQELDVYGEKLGKAVDRDTDNTDLVLNPIKALAAPSSVQSGEARGAASLTVPKTNMQNVMEEYNQRMQKERELREQIEATTAIFGEQHIVVKALQEQYDNTFLTANEQLQRQLDIASQLGEAFYGVAEAIGGIKDNPALKTLAFGMTLLSAATALATARNWVEFIVAAAGVTASTISFIGQMKNQSFAGGGIASPAPVGDQSLVRVNAGEMILNHNQQTRLFNLIKREPVNDAGAGQVEFRLRGQELVGVINNYNRKFKT